MAPGGEYVLRINVAHVILGLIALALNATAFGAPYWFGLDIEGSAVFNAGVWMFCSEPADGWRKCEFSGNIIEYDWFKGFQSMMAIGFLMSLPAFFVLLVYVCRSQAQNRKSTIAAFLLNTATAVFNIIGIAIFANSMAMGFGIPGISFQVFSYTWAFYLVCVGSGLYVLLAIFLAVGLIAS